MDKKHIIWWIAGGAVVAVALIYFAAANDVMAPFAKQLGIGNGGAGGKGGAPAAAPKGVSYNQADAYATSTNVVVTGAPAAPSQSLPVEKSKIPDEAVKLTISKGGFTPASFIVKAGATVILSLTSTDSHGHSFVFTDPSLSSVSVGVMPQETRVITFTAPEKPGSYRFECSVFGDAERGEVGTMIVK